jgi:carboxymethylenebutenolidase
MDQNIINLYDDYTHTPLTRNEFIRRLVLLHGSLLLPSVLPLIEVNAAQMKITSDEDLFTERVRAPVPGNMEAMWRVRKNRKIPAIIIIHENRGLNAHIEDVARRAAKEGFCHCTQCFIGNRCSPANEDEARKSSRN